MAKAIISNRIYIDDLTDIQLKHITDALTYRMEERGFERQKSGKLNPTKKISYLKNYKLLPRGIITIPSGRSDLIPSSHEVIDKRITEEIPFPNPKFPLRELQQEIYDTVDDSCIINAKVGFGKTFLALHIASKLAQRTLVVCHTTALRDQWIEEAESLYGMDIGKIGGGTFDIEDKAIVVSNIQSLKKHLPQISKEFGTVIVDECLDYNSMVETEAGPQKIGTIVNNKKQVRVLSVDTLTGISSFKPINQWFKTKEAECLKISHSGGGSIKCTFNHNVYTYIDGALDKVPAGALKVGDLVAQTTNRHKSTNIISHEWLPIILGFILGDGTIGYAHKASDSLRLKVTHGVDQFEYLEWKGAVLSSTAPLLGETCSGYKKGKAVFNYTTTSFFDHYDLYNKLYTNGSKRKIPKDIASMLTKESWAIMFQDDGNSSKSADCIVFSFCELDTESLENLCDSLRNIFGIEDAVIYTCNKGYNYIRLNQDSTQIFLKSVSSLVHPSMYYKLERWLVHNTIPVFNFVLPQTSIFVEGYAFRKITKIEPSILTGGFKYNIEVADNHNFFANGILVSNCHHVPATTFTEAVDSFYARYKIGLSGTIVRKDGKHVLMPDTFSKTLYQPAVDNTVEPIVRILKPGVFLDPKLAWAQKINALLYDEDYQQFIAKLTAKTIDEGHSVLVIASRIEFLQKVKEYVGETCLLVTGETTLEDRKRASEAIDQGTAQAICGSRQIFSEGISVNRLSAVILAEPMAHDGLVEQIVGRIMRKHPLKPDDPLVYDINFSDQPSRKQNEARMAFYIEKGWRIERY